jgi:signal peptide peptidase SppA
MLPKIIHTVFNGLWAIDSEKAKGYYPGLIAFLKNGAYHNDTQDQNQNKKIYQPAYISGNKRVSDTWEMDHLGEIPENSTVIIPINGVISKYDYCGAPGTNSIADFITKAAGHPNIKNFVFVIDSPGGAVDGTQNLAETILNLDKPTVAFCDGLAASAGYWIASACDAVICNLNTDQVGSIGVYCSFMDLRKWVEYEGIEWHEIYASLSTDKNKPYRDALDGKPELIRAELDTINANFINNVKAGRPQINESVFTGKLYYASDAINLGMIDKIGKFNIALETANNLSNTNNNFNNNAMKLKNIFDFTAVAVALGFIKAENNDEPVEAEITLENITTLNTELQTRGARIKELEAALEGHDQLANDLQAANELLATRGTEIENLSLQIQQAEAEITRLGKTPGEKPTESAVKDDKTPLDESKEESPEYKGNLREDSPLFPKPTEK